MTVLTPYWSLDVFIILLSAVVAAYFYMTRNFNYWQKKGVTEIVPVPFFGNFLDFCLLRIAPGVLFKSLYERGVGLPYVGFYIFDKPALLLRDPDIIKGVIVKDFNHFPNRHVGTHDSDTVASGNVFLAKGPKWMNLRHSKSPIFTSGKMKKMFPLMTTIANELVTHLNALESQGDGQAIEVKQLSAKYVTDVITSCAFGLEVNALNDPDAAFRKCGEAVFGCITFKRCAELAGFFFTPALAKLLNLKFFSERANDFMRTMFMKTMTLRIEGGAKRNDLIDMLIQLKESHKDDPDALKFDDDTLVGLAATFFAAGFETSSSTMAFTLYELASHTDVQSRLRNEITLALKESGGEITYEMVMNLPYLDMVVSETLRKYPSLPFLDRVAIRNYNVPGTDLVIEEGTPVYVPLLGLHYDPEYFPDPEKYDPERFSTDNKRLQRQTCTYAPFGDGPRICIGLRFGLLQSKLGLIKVILNYELTPYTQAVKPIRFDPKAVMLVSAESLFVKARKIMTATNSG